MTLLILFFFLSIVFSFLCSVWEAVLLSITPSYTRRKLREGSPIGPLIAEYKKEIDRPLSAILTLNTIAHTVGAIGVGAQAGALFADQQVAIGPLYLSGASIVASVKTQALLLLSEIIPKTIGANKWEQLAPFTVRSLRILLFILSPLVWVSEQITKRLKKDKNRSVFSRADLSALIAEGEKSGELQESESNIIRNLMKLERLTVRDIMTPRAVMLLADEDTPMMEFYRSRQPLRFSRIPVYRDNPDSIEGLVLKDEILAQLVEDNDHLPLKSIRRPVVAVEHDLTLLELFDRLTAQKAHLAIVVDEFGSLTGLVTLEDLFETLLGLEIVDESDAEVDLQQLARQQWEERARRLGLIE